jgi:hypothetical protein
MAKFWGKIGINRGSTEGDPGIFTPTIEEVEVSGEMRLVGARWQNHELGDTVAARHVLSIITPEDSTIDFAEAVYIYWKNQKWSIISIQYKRPRIELRLGGLYNG